MDILKEKLCKEPILARPDFKRPFILQTDACKTGLGAVLCQKLPIVDEEGFTLINEKGETILKERVICYGSVGTNNYQRNYGATQLELLAVVWALKTYRHYLLGEAFQLETDHAALKWIINQPKVTGILARWVMTMQEFIIIVAIKPGRIHGNVDGLSRIPRPYFLEELSWDKEDPLGSDV